MPIDLHTVVSSTESRRPWGELHGLELGDAALLDATARGKIKQRRRTLELIAAIGAGDYPADARALARDALVRLCQVPGGWTVPPGGIRYRCEACHENAVMRRRRRSAAHPVLWEAADRAALEKAQDPKALRVDYRRRTTILAGHVIWWLLVCPGCARATLRRCKHEDAFGPCEELVTSCQYCERHAACAEPATRADAVTAAASQAG